jgi:hypothetical protein
MLMSDLSTPHGRLAYARAHLAGLRSAADAARRLRVAYPTYASHENGSRGFGPEEAFHYARTFKVDREWLVWGVGNPRGPSITDKLAQLDPDRRRLAESHIDWLAAEQAKERKQ